jgi:hypothetical protein
MVETYIQDFKGDEELGQVPSNDKYFIGRLIMKKGIEDLSFQTNRKSLPSLILEKLNGFYKMNYVALGFMQMVYISGFDQNNYDLKFIHQEFLGEVRTLVFDVSPKPKVKGPHFLGRIWVEDQDYTIVRFNGTYLPERRLNFYFHFDTWRTNMRPGIWLPAFIYSEESDAKYALFRNLAMRSQTRLWGYNLKLPSDTDEYTSVRVDSASKAVEFLQNSPYKDKLGSAGLFLRALEVRSKQLPVLITPQFGTRMAKGDSVLRMSALLQSAPTLQAGDVSQIAALPLGSCIKLDPWDDRVEMKKSKPVPLLSARDKMAFEVTPMIPHLARYRGPQVASAAGDGR